MAEGISNDSNNTSSDSDQDFEPSAEMLVNDFDDEHTLDEEEAMESLDNVSNELDDLQKEGDMPLEDLLVLYGYDNRDTHTDLSKSSSKTILPNANDSNNAISNSNNNNSTSGNSSSTTSHSDRPSGPLLRSVVSSQASESSESGSDEDYSPVDDWRKTIQVGSDYQATVPEGLCKYDDAPAYENEDRLLWDPSVLPDQEVEDYLRQAQITPSSGVQSIPTGNHIRDDEQTLYLLLQCGHNVEEALRRRRMQPLHPTDTMSLWSEEECRSFENGLRTYGKEFYLIQQNKVRTRSVGELVHFYYLWKKTERHDVFASKAKIEKKKYTLHPGTTDYMDRFLDEQDNPPGSLNHRDRSCSPLTGGEKKQRLTPPSSTAAAFKEDVKPSATVTSECSDVKQGSSKEFVNGAECHIRGVPTSKLSSEGGLSLVPSLETSMPGVTGNQQPSQQPRIEK